MRLSGFSLAAILILSSTAFAQHSASNGSSSGSSGSSGGGSHSSSSGGSSGSGASTYSGSSSGHSSSGSSSSGSYHSGSGHSSASSSGSPNSGGSHNGGGTNVVRGDGPSRGAGSDAMLRGPVVGGAASHRGAERDLNGVQTLRTDTSLLNIARPAPSRESMQVRNPQPEKRSFISFLRHPLRKPATKDPDATRGPLCFKGRCPVSPPRKVCNGKDCKNQMAVTYYPESSCGLGEVWNGGACLNRTRFLEDCSGPRIAYEQQAVILRQAEENRRSVCMAGASEQCDNATTIWQSEMNLYQQLEASYQSCLRRRLSLQPVQDESWFAPQFRLEY